MIIYILYNTCTILNILVAGQVGAAKKGPAAIVRMEENSPLATK